MKKRNLWVLGALFTAIACAGVPPLTAYAAETNSVSVNIYHEHVGSEENGGICYSPVYHAHSAEDGACYTPVYHSHKGDEISGGECYSPFYHSHSGNETEGGECYSPVYHAHKGDETNGGECYTEIPHSHGDSCYIYKGFVNTGNGAVSYCSTCGGRYQDHYYTCSCGATTSARTSYCTCGAHPQFSGSSHSHKTLNCNKTTDGYKINCGKDESTVESYSLSCGKDGAIEGYSLSCGKDGAVEDYLLTCGKDGVIEGYKLSCNKDVIATFTVSPSEGNKTVKEMDLTASFSGNGVTGYKWSNGAASATIHVTGNGDYTCTVSYTDAGVTRTKALIISVKNIDSTVPIISGSVSDSEKFTQNKTITVSASDDCGLGEKPFSWDNGSTWTSDNTFTVTKNGTYTVLVKDSVGNVTKKTFTVNKIDREAPVVNGSCSDSDKYTQSKVLSVTASDNAQLAVNPYSWDGGKIWVADNTLTVTKNGTYIVLVKDCAGNVTEKSFEIKKIDTMAPDIDGSVSDADKYTQSKVITVTASDNAELADFPYSWDGGKTWTGSNTFTVTANGTYTVFVKDKAGNITTKTFVVSKIDRVAPVVNGTVSEQDILTQNKVITVVASDNAVLEAAPYSWDNGTTWTADNTLMVLKNGIYTVLVKDSAGNITSKTFEVKNIDTTAPVISGEISDSDKYTQNKVLSVTASDDCGLAENPFSWDNGATWVADNTLTVTKNGTYTVLVKDCAGNVAEKSFTVRTIDTTAPIVSGTVSEADRFTQNKEIVVTASDNALLTDAPFSWDGGKTWTGRNTFAVTANGTYTVLVKDSAGNITEKTFTVTKIDREAPVVTGSVSDADILSEEKTITVTASDNAALDVFPYSWDNGATWTADNTLTVTKNGTYTVLVRDSAGNVTVKTFKVNNIGVPMTGIDPAPGNGDGEDGGNGDNTDPGTGGEETDKPDAGEGGEDVIETPDEEEPAGEEKPVEDNPAADDKNPAGEEKDTAPKKEAETENNSTSVSDVGIADNEEVTFSEEVKAEEKEILEDLVPKDAAIKAETDANDPWAEIEAALLSILTMPIVGVAAGSFLALLLILFLWVRKCSLIDAASGRKVGSAVIWKKNGSFVVKIPNRAAANAEKLMIKFSKHFLKKNEGKPIVVIVQGERVEKTITEPKYK